MSIFALRFKNVLISLHFAITIILTLTMGSTPLPSFAQSTNESANETIEEVLVTGSRLIRKDLTSPSPIVTLGEDDVSVLTTGNVTLEETLNEWPQLVADVTSSLNAPGGAGVLTANLRGLGAARTLVLVDGRRFIPGSGTGLTDLATVPTSLIKRVEIITGGASAVYGSDAIAGAINFILKDDFEGFETSYLYAQSTKGDGDTHDASITFGSNFSEERGNVVLSASYTKRDPVFFSNRKFAATPMIDGDGVNLVPGGSSNVPGIGLRLPGPTTARLVGVDLTNRGPDFGVGPQGSCTGIQGIRFGAGGEVFPFCNPQHNYNFAEVNYLLRPLEKTQISGLAHFDITENTTAFAQAFYSRKENSFQQAAEAITLRSLGAGPGVFLVPNAATNPLYTQAVRDFFANNSAIFDADGDGTASLINAGRRFEEMGDRKRTYVTDSFNITFGLEGEVNLFSDAWHWNLFGQAQHAEEDSALYGKVSSVRLGLGLDIVTNSTGKLVCRTQILGCVPVNPFGINSLTPEMVAFLLTTSRINQKFERKVVGGSVAGDLFNMPAGSVPVAFGFEAREDELEVNPDSVNLANEIDSAVTKPTKGDFNVLEFFVETRVPLFNNHAMMQEFAIEAAARFSDYSTVGSVFTWKGGADWLVNNSVRLRGMYNRAIRAPSLDELFSPNLTTTTGATDPCDSRLSPSQSVKDFCVETGVPANFIDTFVPANPQYPQIVGGNPDLEEEKSNTITFGIVLTPTTLPGLSLSVDYYDIEVEQAVSVVSSQVTLNTCFGLRDKNSPFCKSIARLATGDIFQFDSRNQNFAALNASGIDLQIDYLTELPSGFALPGSGGGGANLELRLAGNWQKENSEKPLPNQPKIECAGFFAGPCSSQDIRLTPERTAIFMADYTSGPASLRTQVRWIDSFTLFPTAVRAVDKIDSIFYVDLNGSFQVTESVELFAGIENIFDEEPTIVGFFAGGDGNADPSTYDVIGRRFFVGAKLGF